MRCVILFCLICLLFACSSPKKELLPARLSADSVISSDEMIHILVDIHTIEAALVLQQSRKENVPLLTKNYYQWLFRKYHISQNRFRDNLNYYKMDPEKFSKMYHEVVKDLTEQAKKQEMPVKSNIIGTSSKTPGKRIN